MLLLFFMNASLKEVSDGDFRLGSLFWRQSLSRCILMFDSLMSTKERWNVPLETPNKIRIKNN